MYFPVAGDRANMDCLARLIAEIPSGQALTYETIRMYLEYAMKLRPMLIRAFCLVLLTTTLGVAEVESAKRPNVVLIIDDQHSPRAMGYTGLTPVRTPNLDRLARGGVRFSAAYANSPVCGPARHSIYTGLYVSDHGVLRNDLPMADVPTMIAMLNRAGYTTANIGKMHNAPYHDRRDFQYVLNNEFFDTPAGISHYHAFLQSEIDGRGLVPDPSWWKAKPGTRSWLEHPRTLAGTHWLPEDVTPERWITEQSLEFVRDQLARRPEKPFFLHASYFPPHHPYGPIAKYAEMYDPAEMSLPPNFNREKLDAWCTGRNTPKSLSDDEVKWMLAHYYAFCTQLDAEVGVLLDGLDRLGVADNTIVIFLSDHGDMLGEHGMFYKGVMYEASVRTPFVIRWPGVTKARVVGTPVMHLDLVPTILRAAGIDVPENLPGRDLRPLLEGSDRWPERSVYSEYFTSRFVRLMIRRDNYKLMATGPYDRRGPMEYLLFDVVADPWEMNDLASDADHRDTLDAMRRELTSIWDRQQRGLPRQMPRVVPRSKYRIRWPADPWKPVEPVADD